jgi:hypothetical protein
VELEILDERGRPIDPAGARLLITPTGAALEALREQRTDSPLLEDMGHGRFRVLDIAAGLPHFDLRPGEVVVFGLSYEHNREARGHAVRVIQSAYEGATRRIIGGQTFVAGEVAGFTKRTRLKSTTYASRGPHRQYLS